MLVGGLSGAAITKLDGFDSFDGIKLCTGYKNKKTCEIIKQYPTKVAAHYNYEPVYERFKGWKTDISGIRKFEDLPEAAKVYLNKLEEILEVPIKIISVGPNRDQTIFK